MQYAYFKSEQGNFGDDLNEWLWPRLFGNTDLNTNYAFWGIGSILYNENKLIDKMRDKRKIVFGTGIRPSETYQPFKLDESWDIRFLRGPLSASALGNKFPYITDAAYALRQLNNFDSLIETPKKYEISLMPYFRSVNFFNWEKVCQELGYHFISPFSENGVEHTIREIAASKHLITEAMHGAIVADVLRVPWHRYILTTPHTEGAAVSEFKWNDWLMSVKIYEMMSTHIKFYRKTFLNKYVKWATRNILSIEIFYKPEVLKNIVSNLKLVNQYYLSTNESILDIDTKIEQELKAVKTILNLNKSVD